MHRVADVEHVHALPAGGYRRPEAGPGGGLLAVPRPEENVLPDDDVTLVAVALRVGQLLRVLGVRDVDHPPAVVVAVEGQIAPERDVRVDVSHAVRLAEEGSLVGTVAQ